MIKVSENYLELMKKEKNNIEHRYTIKNLTRDLDLTDLLVNDNLTVSKHIRTERGTISPNSINLKLRAEIGAPSEILLKDFHHKYKEFRNIKWKDWMKIERLEEYLCKAGDIVEIKDIFNGEEIVVFIGKVNTTKKTDHFLGRDIDVFITDNTITGHDYTFSEDKTFENYYVYKDSEKSKSLLYILCTEYLEFSHNKLKIEDIKDSKGAYIKIPLARFKKGNKIMQEIADIVKSVYGNIYTTARGELVINSLFDKSYLTKSDNIQIGSGKKDFPVLYFIENDAVIPKQNKVEVKYSNNVIEELQTVFSLAGQNAVGNDAKIVVKANTQGQEWWKITFNDVIEINKEPIIDAYTLNGAREEKITYTDYILEFTDTNTARVKFNNGTSKDIYLRQFEFKGKPITTYKDNSITYTEEKELTLKNTNLKIVDFKYVNSKEQAIDLAKHTYYNECRPYSKIKLRTNNMPFLELEDIIKLNYERYIGYYQIIAMTQTNTYTELILKEYKDYEGFDENVITEISSKNKTEKTLAQIEIAKKEQKDALDKMEQTLETLKNLYDALNTKLVEIDKKFNAFSKELEKVKLESVVNDLKSGRVWLTEHKKLGYILNEALNLSMPDTVTNINDAFNYTTFTDALFNNDTISNAFRTHNNGTSFKDFIVNRNGTSVIVKYDRFLELLYKNKSSLSGASAQKTGNFLILEISSSNDFAVEKYGYWKNSRNENGERWSYYKNKFNFLKYIKDYAKFIQNDSDSDDYINYYDLDR